jgi:hypothetical protein
MSLDRSSLGGMNVEEMVDWARLAEAVGATTHRWAGDVG